MIENLPTAEGLNSVALRIFFEAWNGIVEVRTAFSGTFPSDHGGFGEPSREWPEEWREYLEVSQTDLQSACSLLQQSMELGLKARICEVSPYLLLLDTGMKFSTKLDAVDFSTLRTLDAVDLPGAVNTLTDKPVSADFVRRYNELRSIRNKVVHLGEAASELSPDKVIRLALAIYLDMWPGRAWLADRLEFAGRTRAAWLHDGKYVSTHMVVLFDWPVDVGLMTKGEFMALFGREKSRRRYLCHPCVEAGSTRYAENEKHGWSTAHLDDGGTHLSCLMCRETFAVARGQCLHCKANVVGAAGDEWDGRCHGCGEVFDETHPPVSDEPSFDLDTLLGKFAKNSVL